MNTAYAQQPPPHDMHRTSIPNINEAAYRPGPGAPQYPNSHSMPIPQPSQINASYGDPYNPLAGSRAPLPTEGIHGPDGLAPLAPGTQPLAPDPTPRSVVENGRKYELSVVQQPRRARMCGFGDKDRRPITPPPCVRLIITDISTGKEVDCNDIEHGMYVLNVDLWSQDGHREVNLVRHSATSPAISSTMPVPYQQMDSSNAAYSNILPQSGVFKVEPGQGPPNGPYNPYPGPPQVNPYTGSQGQPPYGSTPQYHPGYAPATNGSQPYPPQNGYSQPGGQPVYYTTGAGIHAGAGGPPPGIEYPQQLPSHQVSSYGPGGRSYTPDLGPNSHRGPISNTQPQGMFTRNLIGSLAASAFRLTDPDDRIGIWFVLQDLSVRTEGNFRLRFSFVNVGVPSSPTNAGNATNGLSATAVNTGKAPVLASCYSEVFTVYSAKRFPGVVESTPLSKCFATQGIKIPIRKDGPGKGDKDKEYEDD